MKKITAVVLVLLGAVFLAGCSQWQANRAQPANPTPVLQETAKTAVDTSIDEQAPLPAVDAPNDWKTYTYKNMSLSYPENWVVVFDGAVAGQQNGFSLHITRNGDNGFEPDGLTISTFNNRAGSASDYIVNDERVFGQRQRGDSYIEFTVNKTTIYAGCGYYSKGESTRDVCNKIIQTIAVE